MIVSELTDISRGSERLCVDANWYSVCILACVCDFIYIVPLFLSVPVFLSTFIIQKSVFIFFLIMLYILERNSIEVIVALQKMLPYFRFYVKLPDWND